MSHRFTFPVPTDHAPGGWHQSYPECYERLLGHMKEQPIRLLEIGTDGGGMLRSYREYFPEAAIHGIDISPAPPTLGGHRIFHYQRDAYTRETLDFLQSGFPPGFDVLVDDGPHTFGSQEFFVQHYPNLLTDKGIAIVEDIQDWAHVAHLAALVPPGFFSMGIDLRANSGRYDDILLAIWGK